LKLPNWGKTKIEEFFAGVLLGPEFERVHFKGGSMPKRKQKNVYSWGEGSGSRVSFNTEKILSCGRNWERVSFLSKQSQKPEWKERVRGRLWEGAY